MDDVETQRPIDHTDRDLAEAVLRYGDERAFQELYRRHTPRLLGFVHRLLGREAPEAEDAVQETWVRACDGLERFRWDSLFSTWLLGIGLNTVRERLQRNVRLRSVQLENLPDRVGLTGSTEDRIDLERAIEVLPDGYRMVLVLHDVEGMKHREIAQRLGISAGTSKSQLFQARKLVRGMLGGSREVEHA